MVRHVFEDFLKLANWRTGIVDMTRGALARKLNIPLDELNRCIEALERPDPNSRSPKQDGRRLVRLDGDRRDWGWQIVNWDDYNNLVDKAANQRRVEHHRERKKEASSKPRGHKGGNTPDVPRGTKQEGESNEPGNDANHEANNSHQRQSGPTAEEFLEWGQMQCSGHTPEQIRRLFDYLQENKWRDMNGEPLRAWRMCGWMLTAEKYQRILSPPVARPGEVDVREYDFDRKPVIPEGYVKVEAEVFDVAQATFCSGGRGIDEGVHRILIDMHTQERFGICCFRSNYECHLRSDYLERVLEAREALKGGAKESET